MKLRLYPIMLVALLAGCSREGMIEGGGVYTTRSVCPQVAIPGALGDITLFNPPGRTEAHAIDVSATMTHLRATCGESGGEVVSTATFDILAQRRDAGAARQVVLPYFTVAVRGGTEIVAKRIGYVAVNFPAGGQRAYGRGQATIRVNRAAATLSEDVRRIINRPRKAGDPDAAVDPMNDPAVRAAVAQATFEHLVGFQLTDAQLRYNATR